MRSRTAWKKGAILLQTLVMSIILSMIAIMIMRWVLMRYSLVGRIHRNLTANTRGEGVIFSRFCNANWSNPATTAGIPGSTIALDSPPKGFSLSVVSGTAFGAQQQTVSVTTDQDQ